MEALTHRPLTPAEAKMLHEELKTTPNILGYTVPELLRLQDVYVAEIGGKFAGVCFSVEMPFGWTEIAVLYVLPAFRGQGLGQRLFDAAWKRAIQRERHLYILSRNPQVIEWMKARGMTLRPGAEFAPLAAHLYFFLYMMSLHRWRESMRKWKDIQRGPRLMQGTLKQRKR